VCGLEWFDTIHETELNKQFVFCQNFDFKPTTDSVQKGWTD